MWYSECIMNRVQKTQQKKHARLSEIGKPTSGTKRLRAAKAAGRSLASKWGAYKKAVQKTRGDW